MPVVFVTGGARRIGKHICLGFAERGYDVGFMFNESGKQALETRALIASHGVRCASVQCDVSNEVHLQRALKELVHELGTPDVIVSNAGMLPDRHTIENVELRNVKHTTDVNTWPLLTIAKCFNELVSDRATGRQGDTATGLQSDKATGRLISLSSLGAFEVWKDRLDYNVSKAALVKLVEVLARMLAPSITVNSIAPGAIKVEGETTEAEKNLVAPDKIPLKRHGNPQDIFDAVWFFATNASYITGQTLIIDGGYSLT